MAATVVIFTTMMIVTVRSWPAVTNNSIGGQQRQQQEVLMTKTSTTTPPSVLSPPKQYLLFDSSKLPSQAINTHHYHHHHSVIKLPKIQVHKVYYTSESAPPMSVALPSSQVYFKETKERSGGSNNGTNMVANETKRYSNVDQSDHQSAPQHYHPYHPSIDDDQHQKHDYHHHHQEGYNPSVLEDSEENEEQLMQQSPLPLPSTPPNDDPSSLEARYGMPQIPPPLFNSDQPNVPHHHHHHHHPHHHHSPHPHQILPPEALKQVLRPALSSEMLDDELAQINRQIIHGYQTNRDSFEQYLKKMNYHAKAMADAEPSFTLNFDPNAVTLQAVPVPAPAPPQRESVLTRIIDRMYRASPSTYNAEYVRSPTNPSSGNGFLSNIFNSFGSASNQKPTQTELPLTYAPIEADPIEQVHYIINTPPAARPPGLRLNNIINRHHQQGHLRAAERHVVKAFSHDPAFLPTIVSPSPTKTHLFTLQDAVDAQSPTAGLTRTSLRSKSPSLFYRPRAQQPLLLNEQPVSQIITFAPSDHKPQHKAPQKQSDSEKNNSKEKMTTSTPPSSLMLNLESGPAVTVERHPFVQNYQTFEKLPRGGSKVTMVNSTVNQGPANFNSSSPYKLTINVPSLTKVVKIVKTTEVLEPHEALKHPMINEINKKLSKPTKKQAKKSSKAAFRSEKNAFSNTEIDFTTPSTVYTPLAEFMRNAPINSLDSITSTTHIALPKHSAETSPPPTFVNKVNTTSNSLNSLLSGYSNLKPLFIFN